MSVVLIAIAHPTVVVLLGHAAGHCRRISDRGAGRSSQIGADGKKRRKTMTSINHVHTGAPIDTEIRVAIVTDKTL